MARSLIIWLAFSSLASSLSWPDVRSSEASPSVASSFITRDMHAVKRADKYWLEELGDKGKV